MLTAKPARRYERADSPRHARPAGPERPERPGMPTRALAAVALAAMALAAMALSTVTLSTVALALAPLAVPFAATAAVAAPAPTPSAAAASPGAAVAAVPSDGPTLVLSGAQSLEGKVRFYLTGHNLPPGTALAKSPLSVRADGEELKATVEPVNGTATEAVAAQPRAAVLVLDTSGSMAGAPLDAAREAAVAYSGGLPDDVALGLVTVAERPTAVLAPTTDRARFGAAINAVSASGETALYDGIHEADRMLAARADFSERRIVVLSDGADTRSLAKAADVGTELSLDKVKLDVVAFGPAAGGAELAALATGTGGQLARAADAAALRTAFQGLAGTVSPPVLVTADVPAHLGGRGVTLQVSLKGGPATTTAVTFRPDSRVTVPLKDARAGALPGWVLIAGLLAIAVAVLIGASVLTFSALRRSRTRNRLRQLDSFNGAHRHPGAPNAEEGSAFVRAALAMSDRAVKRRGDQSQIENALDQAAIDLRPEEWILLRIISTVTGAILLALMLPWLFGLVLGTVAGWMLPEVFRRQRAARRARKFADLLPDALQLVVGALRSGFSLSQAVDALVREGPDPVAGEFSRALAEVRLGGELEDALERVATRNNSRDLTWLVMAIRIQREVGGNLSEVMETAVHTMRERAQVGRHVRALSAEGRLSAYVLVSLPVGVSAFMFVSRREYLRPLYTQFLGLFMLGLAAVMLAVGAFWLSRLIKVKV